MPSVLFQRLLSELLDLGLRLLSNFPRKGGHLFYLLLAMHDTEGCEVFEKSHRGQQVKYTTFPTKTSLIPHTKKAKTNVKTHATNKRTGCVPQHGSFHGKWQKPCDETHQQVDTDPDKVVNDGIHLSIRAFTFKKDLLYSMDNNNADPFDRSDSSAKFVMDGTLETLS